MYEITFKEGISPATNIYKGNCDFFYDKKNCYIIKGTDEIEVVIEKRNNRYKIIAIRVLTV